MNWLIASRACSGDCASHRRLVGWQMTEIRPPHLRPRGIDDEQPVTAVELLFDLVFVFAVTQLSHLVLDDLTVRGLLHAGFLLFVMWWGWINTTWLANWLDPASTRVRLVLLAAALASLLLAAAIPRALENHGLLFAVAYVALQSGRNLAATLLAPADHQLRLTFSRLLFWSALAGVLWIAGGVVDPDRRLIVWGAALAVDLLAPIIGYPTPRLGRSRTADYDIEGGHFAERCQGFVIIALGESIVVAGATAANAGLTTVTVGALALAFLGTATLWWLYFDATAANSREDILASEQAGRLARDAFTYLHIPIVAGIIAVAVGDSLLLAHPAHPLRRRWCRDRSWRAGAVPVGGEPIPSPDDRERHPQAVGLCRSTRDHRRRSHAGLLICAGRDRDRDAGHARLVRAVRARTITSTARSHAQG